MARFGWTERRCVLGDALTNRIPLAGAHHYASLWPASPSGVLNAKRDLRQMEDAGYVASKYVLGVTELELKEPVVIWSPGNRAPDFLAVSRHLQSRWTQRPKAMNVYIATPKLVGVFGGFGGKLKNADQARHDLHVAQIYFRLLRFSPDKAALWKSEAWISYQRRPRLAGRERAADLSDNRKVPDAMLCTATGDLVFVIEFGGAYPAVRVAKLHRYCDDNGYQYQLW
jgi:hypothetical protein